MPASRQTYLSTVKGLAGPALLCFVLSENLCSLYCYRGASHARLLESFVQYPEVFGALPTWLFWAGAFLCALSFAVLCIFLVKDRTIWRKYCESQLPWAGFFAASVLLFGSFLRIWHLGSLYDGLHYDEGYKGLDALAIRYFGDRPVFMDWNGGREALVAYLVAFSQLFFGYSSVSVRIVSAVTGSLALVFFFLLVRRWFSQNLAIISTFLMAVSKWHLIHSRYGNRAAEFTVFEVGVLYALLRAFSSEKNNVWWFVLAGIVGGLGFYTYPSYRIFPIVVLAFLLQAPVRRELVSRWKGLMAGGLVSLAIVAPLGLYFLSNPEAYEYRMEAASVWSNDWGETRQLSGTQKILQSTAKTLGMFTLAGDIVAGDNVYEEPMLSPLAAPFFLLGFVLLLANIRKSPAPVILIYFAVTLLPGILSFGAPNARRTLGCIPPAFLITGFGVMAVMELIKAYGRVVTTTFLAVVLGANMVSGLYDSFIRYPAILDSLPPNMSEVWGMQTPQTDVAELLNRLGTRCVAFVSPQFFFHSAVEYLTYGQSKVQLMTPSTHIRSDLPKDHIAVVLFRRRKSNLWWLADDEGLNLFKWWRQAHRMSQSAIVADIGATYGSHVDRGSDNRIVQYLEAYFPGGTYLDFDRFSIYIVKPKRSN